ncbi:hypothetical protein CFOL_v3_06481 [Cephalotus follicularis]|uniref:Uncharacterized protein n=1 Tax=Cephalotus follicularis TaxID=3775 RepID=A0A1Q3B4U9_CEPFO|nr:hypothetical protein CFOL_v3_06481 [Cephalotus follicularis]
MHSFTTYRVHFGGNSTHGYQESHYMVKPEIDANGESPLRFGMRCSVSIRIVLVLVSKVQAVLVSVVVIVNCCGHGCSCDVFSEAFVHKAECWSCVANRSWSGVLSLLLAVDSHLFPVGCCCCWQFVPLISNCREPSLEVRMQPCGCGMMELSQVASWVGCVFIVQFQWHCP